MFRWTKSKVAAVVGAAVLAFAVPASAHYFMNQKLAVSHARTHFHLLGYHFTAAQCHPKGRAAPQPGFLYHSWTCNFAAGDSRFAPSCTGVIVITGTDNPNNLWYFQVLNHFGPCPKGVQQS